MKIAVILFVVCLLELCASVPFANYLKSRGRYLNLRNVRGLTEIDFDELKEMTNLTRINLGNLNLKRVKNPSALQFLNVEDFLAEGNQIENAREIIENLNPSIHRLILSGSTVGQVNVDLFKNLPNVITLDLKNTNMTIVDSSPFDQLKELMWLDISGNDLSNAKVPIFSGTMEEMVFLDATNCRIKNAGEIFNKLPLAGSITLSGNFVGELTADIFKNLTRVWKLSLDETNLIIVNQNNPFEKLDQLIKLELSNNDLSNVNFQMLSKTLQSLVEFAASNCKITNSREILNLLGPSIELIDLSGNFVGELPADAFKKFKDFRDLYLNNTNLSIGDSNPFESLKQLYDLDISENDFSNFNFTIISSTLQELSFFKAASCQIQNANDILKHINAHIHHLDLSENPIGELDFDEFKRIKWPHFLNLGHTNLTKFDFSVLEPYGSFNSFVNISFNHLQDLNISSTLPYLEMLDVRGNELTEIRNLNRRYLPKLQTLGIAENRFSCEYLEQVKNELNGLKFIGDENNQKDKKCILLPAIVSTTINGLKINLVDFFLNHLG